MPILEAVICAQSIHISKAGFKPADEQLFDQVVASAQLVSDQAPPSHSGSEGDLALRYFGEGSRYYLQKNYVSAAKAYQAALDLEKQKRTLSRDYFRVLVDNLGMSYGITGKLAEAKTVFEYGLTEDPEYPMFYYNIACVYGEMGKMAEALDQLRLVYKYRDNVISGEPLPDPLTDDSFRKFVNNPHFVSAVREMQK